MGVNKLPKAAPPRPVTQSMASKPATKPETPKPVDHFVASVRDAATGLPTGQRMHKPLMITKELDRTPPPPPPPK